MTDSESEKIESLMRSIKASFEASLPQAALRASKIQFQNVIPGHWFSAAASECMKMYVDGHFYGAISISQAYIEALGKFITECHGVRPTKDVALIWQRLTKKGIVSGGTQNAAKAILDNRNDFHHLNKGIETDYQKLEARGLECLTNLHIIESEVFSHSFVNGAIMPHNSRYWAEVKDDQSRVQVYLRNL
jgi:hypothetical protein